MFESRNTSCSIVFIRTAATLAAALIASAGLADSVKPVAAVVANEPGQPDREVLAATFIAQDDGAPGKMLPEVAQRERIDAPWDRPAANVAPELIAAELQSFYMYSGGPIQMTLDGARIAVKVASSLPAPNAAIPAGPSASDRLLALARQLGLPATEITSPNLSQPLADRGAANAVIELLLTDPSIAFASPVFNDPAIEGGFVVITPEINARVREVHAANAGATIAAACKGMTIVHEQIPGLVGSVQLRSINRNGFVVLKEANTLALDARFAWAEPDKVATLQLHYTSNDPFRNDGGMWGWENSGAGAAMTDFDTDAYAAFDLTHGSSAIKILVMDTGTQQSHPDINQFSGQDFTTGAVNGTGTGDPLGSCDDHGTCVAGIITGRIDNSIGAMGVAPKCRVVAARIASQQTNPCRSLFAAFSTSWVANALNWGDGQGCRITNSSFGCGASDTLTDAYQNTDGHGINHFASTGNGGSDNIGDPVIGYPANISGIVSVGAVESNGTLTSFSNWGSSMNYVTPGSGVFTPDQTGSAGYVSGDYAYFGGTSAASPFAAGICALIWSAYPFKTDLEIIAIMNANCRDMGAAGYDTVYGYGFPNVNDALRSQSPSNTWCATSRLITSAALTFSASMSSVANAASPADGPQENCELNNVGVSHAVWYRFDPPCVGTLNLNTNGSTYDTVLSVFRGTCQDPIQVACDDDSGTGTQSQITALTVSSASTYYIKIAAYGVNNAGGALDFNFTYDPTPPANDHCGEATNISVTPWTSIRCTVGATNQGCELNESCELNGVGTSKSVWWEYTPTANGKADLDTAGSAYDTVASIWNGCPLGLLFNGTVTCLGRTQIACDDDGGTGTTSLITGAILRKGMTYKMKVSAYGAAHAGGDMTMHFDFHPCPADYNASGNVSVQDIFDFLLDYFAADLDADMNNSGTVTVQDIFDYLSLYFAANCS